MVLLVALYVLSLALFVAALALIATATETRWLRQALEHKAAQDHLWQLEVRQMYGKARQPEERDGYSANDEGWR